MVTELLSLWSKFSCKPKTSVSSFINELNFLAYFCINVLPFMVQRMDPEKRHSTALIKWRPLLQGVRCVEDTLVHFHLYNSGLDDCEIDLAQAMLLCAAKLKIFVMLARDASDDALRNLETVIYGTDPASQSIMTLELGLSSGDP